MTKTWEELSPKLDYFMDDELRLDAGGEEKKRRFPIPLRIFAWNWAQKMLCAHTPRQRKVELTIDTGNRAAVIPDDLYAIEGIYDAELEQWWRPMRMEPGDIRYRDEDLPEWWIWGRHIYLETAPSYDTTDLTLYYWAYYPDVAFEIKEDELVITRNVIYTPGWAEAALCHLATAFCWTPGAISAADINEYKITVDSGTPLHNPRSQQAREHLFWWNVILENQPRPQVMVYRNAN